jgi:hypothetical protein
MNNLLDTYLCQKYPLIFCERNLSPEKTCMCRGFPGSGWFFLINGLCSMIQTHIDKKIHKRKKGLINFTKMLIRKCFLKFNIPNKMIPMVEYEYITKGIPQVVAKQVKEKFGKLCFYYSGGDDYIKSLVDFAEYLSGKICEDCGAMNENVGYTTNGWIRIVCSQCLQKSNPLPEILWNPVQEQNVMEIWQKIFLEKKD